MIRPRILALLTCTLLMAGCSHIEGHTSRHDGLPRDVGSFLDRRSACGDYRGDAFFDDDRSDFMADQSAMYCSGTERELKSLRAKYASRPDIIAALDRLEADLGNR